MTSASKTSRGVKRARASLGTPAKSSTQAARRGSSAAPGDSPHGTTERGARARASVRVYCQGLGDCILVRVTRQRGGDFKLLIDCGVVLGTDGAIRKITEVVENVVNDTKEKPDDPKGKIDILAITHEHWDHLSGFNQAANSFEKLSVDSVWVAWTEDPNDDLAKQLKRELGKAEEALATCAAAFHATGDGATVDLLSDIALTAFGAAAAASGTSTKAAFDKAKAMAEVKICWPSGDPFEIADANARIYVIGPPHDSKLIRKINPSTTSPETYGIAMNGEGALPLGIISALDCRKAVAVETSPLTDDSKAPFHPRVTIPLGPKGQPWSFDDGRSVDKDDWKRIDDFLRENYYGRDDWRRIDGDWLGPATELALALQSYTNNTSLVLALELGDVGKGDVLLFAADAQVGNWESWQTWQWEKDGNKVTGPDLLKRTIFYKVGHHGSHNATLKEHGVDQMVALKAAIIPVDEKEALKKRWGRMPLPGLIAALEKRATPAIVLRTDQKPADPPDNIVIGDNYFEVRL
jgi:Metallo-beta-lactamase superfamily